MYNKGAAFVLGLVITPAAVEARTGALARTGFSTATYVLLGLGLLATGLLLVRIHHRPVPAAQTKRRPVGRAVLVLAVIALGLLPLVFTDWWRGVETVVAAHGIQLASRQTSTAHVHSGIVVLYQGARPVSAFALTSQCTVGYVLGVMVISAAPLLFLRRLSMARVGLAVVVTAVVLMAVNMIRLTAIGVAILAWGEGGFSVAHTYLGSLLTFIGTCLAGAAFVLVLIARPRPVTSVEAPV